MFQRAATHCFSVAIRDQSPSGRDEAVPMLEAALTHVSGQASSSSWVLSPDGAAHVPAAVDGRSALVRCPTAWTLHDC
jgi:hypothetical protein